jgi:hypothetical protein
MQTLTVALIASGVLFAQVPATWADTPRVAQAAATPTEKTPGAATERKMPSKSETSTVRIRGTVDAVDKDKGTVTLKGPKGRTLTLDVRDKQKLEMIQVGDPVVATYMEAVAYKVLKAGSGTPGVSVKEGTTTSKPGETPAGAVGREVTVTATITAIDKKAHTVTIKGPQGNSETIKAKDPKNLEAIKVGDLVDITYAQALVVSLDKPAPAKPGTAKQ